MDAIILWPQASDRGHHRYRGFDWGDRISDLHLVSGGSRCCLGYRAVSWLAGVCHVSERELIDSIINEALETDDRLGWHRLPQQLEHGR